MKINPLLALGLPTWGTVSVDWARAYRHLGGPLGSNMLELQPVVGKRIAEARNEILQAAIDNHADFLFFLGDDVLPQPDAIMRLLQRCWDDPTVDLVTGVYWTKQWPTQPYLWRGVQRGPFLDWRYGEYLPVDFAGCDCLLVRLSDRVKALGPEWFSTTWAWEGEPGEQIPMLATEDFYFYTRARAAGLKLMADTLVQCVHEDRNSRQQFALTTEMPQYTGSQEPDLPDAETDAAPLVKLADLGAGHASPYFGRADAVKVVRFDADETIRPDYRCDIRHLPAPDQSFDVVHARHVLEHFGREEAVGVLAEWTRILRVGGELRLSMPNLLAAARDVLLMEEGLAPPDPYPYMQVYGGRQDHRDVHQNGFTPKRLRLLLERLGTLENIEVETRDGDSGDLNLYARATKARHAKPHALLPDWDAIQQTEGIVVPGLNGVVQKETIPA